MDEARCRALFGSAPVARLATVGSDGPHIVPIVFAIDGDTIVTAIDHKPKTTRRLRRLDNIHANPNVSVLVDHYDDDWRQLWWVRADGTAVVIDDLAAMSDRLDLLVAKYPQYRTARPNGPLIEIAVTKWSGWSSS